MCQEEQLIGVQLFNYNKFIYDAAHEPQSYSYDDGEFDKLFYKQPRNITYMENDKCLSKTDKASCNDESNKPPCTYMDKPTGNWVYKNINAGVCLPADHESRKYSDYNKYVKYVNEKSAEAHKIKAELTAKNALEKQEKEKKEKEDKEEEETIRKKVALLLIKSVAEIQEYIKGTQYFKNQENIHTKALLSLLITKAGITKENPNPVDWKSNIIPYKELTKVQKEKILKLAHDKHYSQSEITNLKKYFIRLAVINNIKEELSKRAKEEEEEEKIRLATEDKFVRELQEKQQEKGLIPHQGGNYVNYKKSKYNYINLKQF